MFDYRFFEEVEHDEDLGRSARARRKSKRASRKRRAQRNLWDQAVNQGRMSAEARRLAQDDQQVQRNKSRAKAKARSRKQVKVITAIGAVVGVGLIIGGKILSATKYAAAQGTKLAKKAAAAKIKKEAKEKVMKSLTPSVKKALAAAVIGGTLLEKKEALKYFSPAEALSIKAAEKAATQKFQREFADYSRKQDAEIRLSKAFGRATVWFKKPVKPQPTAIKKVANIIKAAVAKQEKPVTKPMGGLLELVAPGKAASIQKKVEIAKAVGSLIKIPVPGKIAAMANAVAEVKKIVAPKKPTALTTFVKTYIRKDKPITLKNVVARAATKLEQVGAIMSPEGNVIATGQDAEEIVDLMQKAEETGVAQKLPRRIKVDRQTFQRDARPVRLPDNRDLLTEEIRMLRREASDDRAKVDLLVRSESRKEPRDLTTLLLPVLLAAALRR